MQYTFIHFTEVRLLFWLNLSFLNMGIVQTKLTQMWVLDIPKCRKGRIGQTKQCKMWLLAWPNRPKIAIGETEGGNQIFFRPLSWVAPDPLSRTQVGLANICLGFSSWIIIGIVCVFLFIGLVQWTFNNHYIYRIHLWWSLSCTEIVLNPWSAKPPSLRCLF